MNRGLFRVCLLAVPAVMIIVLGGCSLMGEPRVRLGCYATSTPGTRFIDDKGLGSHNYDNLFGEGNGIAYTCNGGHIDIAHLRIGADNTRWLYYKMYHCIAAHEKGFTYGLNVDRSVYYVTMKYPDNWNLLKLEEKKKIAQEVSLECAQYLTFTMTTWHEVLTWYGFKTMGVVPETPSAFSWEDVYSNLLGTRLGAEALQDKNHKYNEAMTIALNNEMSLLGIQSHKVAYDAAEKMRGKWFTGTIDVDMIERNFDIGLDDGMVTPMLVPGICPDQNPKLYPVPTLKKTEELGFNVALEIEPHEFEKGKILKIVYADGKGTRIKPDLQMAGIIEQLKLEQKQMHKK